MLEILTLAAVACVSYLVGRWHAKRLAAKDLAASIKAGRHIQPRDTGSTGGGVGGGGGGGGPLEPK